MSSRHCSHSGHNSTAVIAVKLVRQVWVNRHACLATGLALNAHWQRDRPQSQGQALPVGLMPMHEGPSGGQTFSSPGSSKSRVAAARWPSKTDPGTDESRPSVSPALFLLTKANSKHRGETMHEGSQEFIWGRELRASFPNPPPPPNRFPKGLFGLAVDL